MPTWLASIGAKIGGYFWAIVAVLGAIAGAVLYGREKGEVAEETKTQNQVAKADVKVADAKQTESRDETNVQVEKLPDAPAQQVGTADPNTAAGKLSEFDRD
jgi:hypothetical protein